MENIVDEDQPHGKQKPRRLEDDTADYLAQIDHQFSDTAIDEEVKQTMVENVLTEISNRLASVATDKRTNYLLERMIEFMPGVQSIITVCERFGPYAVFLARNRYSSHIVQSLFARICYIIKYDEYNDECTIEMLSAAVVQLARPLVQETTFLIREQCASHVMRALFCLLTGMPVIAERKGKSAKHQHAISLAEPLESLKSKEHFRIDESHCFSVPAHFHELLMQVLQKLVKLSSVDLEVLLANTSSSAVLGLLLRIVSNEKIFEACDESTESRIQFPQSIKLCRQLLANAFNWPQLRSDCEQIKLIIVQEKVPQSARNIVYSMAGDSAGSYFLETAIECSELEIILPLVGASIESNVRDYSSDKSGNFVLQAIFRRYAMELKKNMSSSATASITKQVHALIEELSSNFDYFKDLVNKKGGVVYWILAVLEYMPVEMSDSIGMSVISSWTSNEDEEAVMRKDDDDDDAAFTIKKLSAALSTKFLLKNPVTKVQGNKKGGDAAVANVESRNDSTQLLIAKIIALLLKSRSNKVSSIMSTSFANLSPESLLYIATTGSVSRAVLDIFCERFRQSIPLKILSSSLCINGVDIAQHYVGQHVLRQVYESSDVRGKEKWAMLLANNRTVLMKTKEGRNSLQLVNAELYQHDAAEWRSGVKRKAKAEMLLHELVEDKTKVSMTSRSTTSIINDCSNKEYHNLNQKNDKKRKNLKDNDNVFNDEEKSSSRKRKRKRSRRTKDNTIDDDDEDDEVVVLES